MFCLQNSQMFVCDQNQEANDTLYLKYSKSKGVKTLDRETT